MDCHRPSLPVDPVQAWVAGWSASRDCAWQSIDGGWAVETGTAKEARRYVIEPSRDDKIQSLLRHQPIVNSCVKVVGNGAWLHSLPHGWVPTDPAWLMTHEITSSQIPPPSPPRGYHLAYIHNTPSLLGVEVRNHDGELAASGQAGFTLRSAVPDQIVTDERHRRRGLGTLVMDHLEAAARDRGITTSVLGATRDGRSLYRKIGWHEAGELFGAYYQPSTPVYYREPT